jgi:hypothetical protein
LLIETTGPISNQKIINQQLFDLFVRRVLAATVAEFFEFQPVRRRFAVLRSRIVPLFALTTL